MGLFDSAKEKAGGLAGEHQDKVGQGVEQGGDFIDEKTGGQHADKVDQGQQFATEQFGGEAGGGEAGGEGAPQQ